MYLVKYGDKYIHNPNIKDCVLDDLSMTSEQNSCGYCDFTLYKTHPLYGKLKALDFENEIVVYENEQILFSGYINELEEDEGCSAKCNGDLYCLNYSIVEPYSTGYSQKKENRVLVSPTVDGYFKWLIDQHNDQVEDSKKFKIGINQGAEINELNYILTENIEYPTTFDELKEKLLEDSDYGGYIKVYWKNGERYIDYLVDWYEESTQRFEFTKNIIDYSVSNDSDDVYTCVLPTGSKLSESDYYYNNGYSLVNPSTPFDKTKTYYTKSFSEWKAQSLMLDFEYNYKIGDLYFEYDKSKIGYSTKPSSETTPQRIIWDGYDGKKHDWGVRKTYYTKDDSGNYSACGDLDAFESGTTYYVYNDGYYPTKDTEINSDKTYYRPIFTYNECDENLASFEKIPSYYTYSEYDDCSDMLVTLKNLSKGSYTFDKYVLSEDKLLAKENIITYGILCAKYENSDLTSAEYLLAYAMSYLSNILNPAKTIEVKALDLSLMDPSLDTPVVGRFVRITHKKYDVDAIYLCSKVELDFNNPENSKFTFGVTKDTLTSRQNQRLKELKKNQEDYKIKMVKTEELIAKYQNKIRQSDNRIKTLETEISQIKLTLNKLGGNNVNTK